MRYSLITFLSDFGLFDEYVPACLGVIKSIAPGLEVVNLNHQIPAGDVLKGAFTLAASLPYFPENSIHLAIVDPGVGSKRKKIVLKTRSGSLLVGPDNGLFSLVLARLTVDSIREIKNSALFSNEVAPTFEGRDVFAPTAANLALGFPFEEVGPEVKEIVKLELPRVQLTEDGLKLTVIDIDRFGTVRFNFSFMEEHGFPFKPGDVLTFSTSSVIIKAPFVRTFSEVRPGLPLFFKDSSGYLALAVNQGRASSKFKLKRFHFGILSRAKSK